MTERERLPSEEPQDSERRWLDRLAPGDEVFVYEHGVDRLASVERRLPSGHLLVTCDGRTREFTFYGRLHTSGTYSAIYLAEPTPYHKGMLEKLHLAHYLAEQRWHHLPLTTLRQIAALVQSDSV